MQNQRTSKLRERADIIRNSVNKTADHLQEQAIYTTKLVQQALSFVKAVSVFKIKEVDKEILAADPNIEKSDMNPDLETSMDMTMNMNKDTDTDTDTDTGIMSNSTTQEKTEKIDLNMDIDIGIKLDE